MAKKEMAKKVSIEFNLKIPRNDDHTFSLQVPVTELAEDDNPSVDGVVDFVKRKIALSNNSVFQLKVLNGREIVAAWKAAKKS
jgi:hypothetical protein